MSPAKHGRSARTWWRAASAAYRSPPRPRQPILPAEPDGTPMNSTQLLQAGILGVLEGGTEFLPVSSTGHLLLLQHFFGLTSEANKTFAILIQFGAILAILSVYFARLWRIAMETPRDPDARRLVLEIGRASCRERG